MPVSPTRETKKHDTISDALPTGQNTKQGVHDGGDSPSEPDNRHDRPLCLAPPSPPSPPSKTVTTDRLLDKLHAQFAAQCAMGLHTDAFAKMVKQIETQCTTTAVARARKGKRRTSASRSGVASTSSRITETPLLLACKAGVSEAMERTAQCWIEIVTGRRFASSKSREFARNLKTGERLCSLVNAIRPGTIKQVQHSFLGYEQIANINNFLGACCKLGVPSHALVEVEDIFELRDTTAVVRCVHALASAVQASCPSFRGPHLGPPADPADVAVLMPLSGEEDNCESETVPSGLSSRHSRRGTLVEKERTKGKAISSDDRGASSTKRDGSSSLVLNMEDVERPRSIRREYRPTVGSVGDLRPPTPMSTRAVRMCPKEVAHSPRALVFDTDPLGHPTRSSSLSAGATFSATYHGTDSYAHGVDKRTSFRKTWSSSKRGSDDGQKSRDRAHITQGLRKGQSIPNAADPPAPSRDVSGAIELAMAHVKGHGGHISPFIRCIERSAQAFDPVIKRPQSKADAAVAGNAPRESRPNKSAAVVANTPGESRSRKIAEVVAEAARERRSGKAAAGIANTPRESRLKKATANEKEIILKALLGVKKQGGNRHWACDCSAGDREPSTVRGEQLDRLSDDQLDDVHAQSCLSVALTSRKPHEEGKGGRKGKKDRRKPTNSKI